MGLFEDHLLAGNYPYLTPEQFIASCPEAAGADPEDELVLDAIEDASLIIYYLTGRQFDGTRMAEVYPELPCDACSPHRLNLGLWPITSIVEVRSEGEFQDITDYHIDEYRYLVRNDGEPFPRTRNWYSEPEDTHDNEDDGYVFRVTVEYGMVVPRLVRRATRAMACVLYNDAKPGCEDCELPPNVRTITRAGVSFELDDIPRLIQDGSTGIYAVDLAIKVLNPSGLQSPSLIWSPDLVRGNRRYT